MLGTGMDSSGVGLDGDDWSRRWTRGNRLDTKCLRRAARSRGVAITIRWCRDYGIVKGQRERVPVLLNDTPGSLRVRFDAELGRG